MDETRYSDIPGYPGYRVGSDGSVWSCRLQPGSGYTRGPLVSTQWRRLQPSVTAKGYHRVRLSSADFKPRNFKVHRLVALAFIPNPSGATEVNHKNGNKADNAAGNLEWVTRTANVRHGYRTGLLFNRSGEEAPNAKLTAADVRTIRQERRNGRTLVSLAAQFKVNYTYLSGVATGRHRAEVARAD